MLNLLQVLLMYLHMLQSLEYVLSYSAVNLSGLLISVQHLTRGRLLRWRQMCSLSCTPVHSCRSAIRRQARGTPLPLPAAPDEIKGVNRQRKWESCSENPPTQSAATTERDWKLHSNSTVGSEQIPPELFSAECPAQSNGKVKGQSTNLNTPPPQLNCNLLNWWACDHMTTSLIFRPPLKG